MTTDSPLYVSEIFGPTIQGEGRRRGVVSSFLRLAKCNMQCKGFGVEYTVENETKFGCDTWYAVDSAFTSKWLTFTSGKDLLSKFEQYHTEGTDIVISGGEPLLYWNHPVFQEFITHFTPKNTPITIETNGTIPIDISKDFRNKIIFSISLKLSNSLESEKKRFRLDSILALLRASSDSYLKFVVSKETLEKDLEEIETILHALHRESFFPDVYLMPLTQGESYPVFQKNAQSAVQACIDKGFIFSNRDHFTLWGDKAGV